MGPKVFQEPVPIGPGHPGNIEICDPETGPSLAASAAGCSAMKSDAFSEPVLVDDAPFGVRKIRCAMDAIEFLEEWPFEKRGRLHGLASDACCAAYDGRGAIAAARRVFVTWAVQAGVCACAPRLELDAGETGGPSHKQWQVLIRKNTPTP
ncbi:DUF982 domain-containing protein [Mesorhizobium sp. WSM4884]|uniref:DUF982 domain-containing protein n=1 Tax=Mesorhizobium sp. WSM4884 TaxID=3038542 RepID=UPI0024171724|nr:DUF982 domain-containing protein [Mesorhizobium sp. WSM4884]MDG4881945.1 DUF982 domain-containing protein [Mesorhizobium sp. WSM4884]